MEPTETPGPILVEPIQLKLRAKGGIQKKYQGIFFSNNQGLMRRLSPKQKVFLKSFANNPIVGRAAQDAEITKQSHYYWMRTDEVYKKIFEGLSDIIVGDLEEAAQTRAIEGVAKDVYFQGTVVGQEQQYSDTLLMFLLKAKRPEIYRERTSIDLNTKPINLDDVDPQLKNLSFGALSEIREIIERDTAQHAIVEGSVEASPAKSVKNG